LGIHGWLSGGWMMTCHLLYLANRRMVAVALACVKYCAPV
jgi:hypothetical protein